MSLLKIRDRELCNVDNSRLSSHYFESNFLSILHGKKYSFEVDLKSRSLNLNIFSLDKIFFPSIKDNHWTLFILFVQIKEIQYFDSSYGMVTRRSRANKDINTMLSILHWVADVAIHQSIYCDISQFKLIDYKTPQQFNTTDCGVFMIMYADFLSDNLPLTFSAANISFFRNKIAANITRGSLTYTLY